MKEFMGLMVFGVLFFGIGWIFIRADWALIGCMVCLWFGWVATKIQDKDS